MAKRNSSTTTTELQTSLSQTYAIVQELIEKKLIPAGIKTSEMAAQIIEMGQSLGMTPQVALNSIEMIQGNLAIKAKIIPGLLNKKGIALRIIHDYEPVYVETMQPVVLRVQDPTTGAVTPKMIGDKPAYELNEDGTIKMVPVKTLKDYVTKVEIIRDFGGAIGVVKNEVEFTWSMAVSAGWDSKQNWKQNPRYMMMARTISRAARIAAADVIGGLYDNYEVMDFSDVDYSVED